MFFYDYHYIKIIRKYNLLTQQEVASQLGLQSASTISKYENGERDIPLKVLETYQKVFKQPADIPPINKKVKASHVSSAE